MEVRLFSVSHGATSLLVRVVWQLGTLEDVLLCLTMLFCLLHNFGNADLNT